MSTGVTSEEYQRLVNERNKLLSEKWEFERTVTNPTRITVEILNHELELNRQIKEHQANIFSLLNKCAAAEQENQMKQFSSSTTTTSSPKKRAKFMGDSDQLV